MRTKRISLLVALVFLIGAMTLPMTAFAAGGKDTTPPTLTAVLDGETVKIVSSDDNSGVEAVYIDKTRVNSLVDGKASVALKDYAGTDKKVSVYAVDYAGNRSDAVQFDNPYYKEPVSTEKPAAPTQPSQSSTPATKPVQTQAASSGSTGTQSSSSNTGTDSGGTSSQDGSSGSTGNSGTPEPTTSSVPEGAFTPEGTGTVLDSATGEDGDKQFYTITTEAGNVFYLIIDGKRDDNNVYFLNGVTEADLMALAEKNDGSVSVIPAADVCTCKEKCEAGKVNTGCPVCKNDLNGCLGKVTEEPAPEETEQPEAETEKSGGNTGMIIFLVIALVAAGGLGYYFKIVRPKQQAAMDEDEFEDDGYGEDYEQDSAYSDELPYDEDEESTKDGR